MASREKEKDKSKVHKLSLKGSSKLVAEFVSSKQQPSTHLDTYLPKYRALPQILTGHCLPLVPILDTYHIVRIHDPRLPAVTIAPPAGED